MRMVILLKITKIRNGQKRTGFISRVRKSAIIPLAAMMPRGNKYSMRPLQFTLPPLEVISKDPGVNHPENDGKQGQELQQQRHDDDGILPWDYQKEKHERITFWKPLKCTNGLTTAACTDMVSLYKSRKSTDYNKLDTLFFKLMEGLSANIYLDVMRYPDYIFSEKYFWKLWI